MSILTNYLHIQKISEDKSILINLLTSALDIIDNHTKIKIENLMNGNEDISYETDAELYRNLVTRGYLYNSKDDEINKINKLKILNENLSRQRANTSFTICPTMGCNLRCTYCFESNSQHTDFQLMTDDQLQGLFHHIYDVAVRFKELYDKTDDQYKENIKAMAPKINLFGGEPLLKCNYDLVSKTLNFADKTGIPVHIITNGTTIDHYADLLYQYRKIINIQITIDGNREVHNKRRIRADGSGTFDEICCGIDKVLELGIRLNLRINVDKENLDYISELKQIMDDREWSSNPLFFPYVSPVQDFCGSNDDTTLKEHELLHYLLNNKYFGSEEAFIKGIVSPVIGYLIEFFNPKHSVKPWKMDYCEATSGRNFCFSPDGKISTCLTYVGKGNHNIGTYDKDGINIDPDKYEMWMGRTIFRIEKCRNCKYALLCGGGCPVAALEQNKDIDCVICSDIEKTLDVYLNYIKKDFIN